MLANSYSGQHSPDTMNVCIRSVLEDDSNSTNVEQLRVAVRCVR